MSLPTKVSSNSLRTSSNNAAAANANAGSGSDRFTDIFAAWVRDGAISGQPRQRDEAKQFQRRLVDHCSDDAVFRLRSSGLSVHSAEAIYRACRDRPELRILDLYGNHFGENTAYESIAKLLHRNRNVKVVDLGSNDLTPMSIVKLAEELRNHPGITILRLGTNGNDLHTNHIDSKAAHVLCTQLMAGNNSVRVLDLRRNEIGRSGLLGSEALASLIKTATNAPEDGDSNEAEALIQRTSALSLNVPGGSSAARGSMSRPKSGSLFRGQSNMSVGFDDAEDALKYVPHPPLRRLYLGSNELEDEGAFPIIEALSIPNSRKDVSAETSYTPLESVDYMEPGVHTVDFSDNLLGAESGGWIGEMLTRTRTLAVLNLSRNPDIGPNGSSIIGESLGINCTLVALDLSNCQVGDEGVAAIADGLSRNCTLTYLNLSNNGITSQGVEALTNALHVPTVCLSHLILSKNPIRDEGVQMLADALSSEDDPDSVLNEQANLSLNILELNSAKIGNEGAMALFYAMLYNTTLRHIRLRDNFLSEAKILVTLLSRSQHILTADFRGNQLDHTFLEKVKKITRRNRDRAEQKEPVRLEKEVIRLRFQKEKLVQAERELREHMRRRETLQEMVNETRENISLIQQEEHERREEFAKLVEDQKKKITETEEKIHEKEAEFEKLKAEMKVKFDELQEQIDLEVAEKEKLEEEVNMKNDRIRDLKDNGPKRIDDLRERIRKAKEKTADFHDKADELRERMRRYREQQMISGLEAQASESELQNTAAAASSTTLPPIAGAEKKEKTAANARGAASRSSLGRSGSSMKKSSSSLSGSKGGMSGPSKKKSSSKLKRSTSKTK